MALISLPRPGHTTVILLEADPMSVGGETSFCATNRLVYLSITEVPSCNVVRCKAVVVVGHGGIASANLQIYTGMFPGC